MAGKHVCDTNGNRTGPFETSDGVKIYTYYKQHCSQCGKYTANDTVNTRDKNR